VSGERIDVTPDPTPEEAEAIRRALEALGLLEPTRPDGDGRGGSDPASAAVTGP
jgi:hypothetical protein